MKTEVRTATPRPDTMPKWSCLIYDHGDHELWWWRWWCWWWWWWPGRCWKTWVIGKHCLCKTDEKHIKKGGNWLANHRPPEYEAPGKQYLNKIILKKTLFSISEQDIYGNSVFKNKSVFKWCWSAEVFVSFRLPLALGGKNLALNSRGKTLALGEKNLALNSRGENLSSGGKKPNT